MSNDSLAPTIRRLCIAVDAERYSSLDRAAQARAQQHFVAVMTAARRAADLDPSMVHAQPAGDGELALLPPGIDETEVIAHFVRGLRDALFAANRSAGKRIRLRVAMHSGLTQLAANGFAGRAVVTVSRMCESPQLKQRLAAHPEADLVLVLSDSLYQDHVGDDFFDIRADAFEQITLSVGDKFRAEGWVYLPDYRPGSGSPDQVQHFGGGITTSISNTAGRDNVQGNVYNNGRDGRK